MVFLHLFACWWKDPGAGQKNYGSGSRRPKNIRIWIRLRIQIWSHFHTLEIPGFKWEACLKSFLRKRITIKIYYKFRSVTCRGSALISNILPLNPDPHWLYWSGSSPVIILKNRNISKNFLFLLGTVRYYVFRLAKLLPVLKENSLIFWERNYWDFVLLITFCRYIDISLQK